MFVSKLKDKHMKRNAILILEATLKKGRENELQKLLSKYLPETRKYKGFISIEILKSSADNTVVFYEEWETTKHYEAYLKWRTDTGVMKILGDTFVEPPSIRYFNSLDF
jgi:quinol monooxygenase YgiN